MSGVDFGSKSAHVRGGLVAGAGEWRGLSPAQPVFTIGGQPLQFAYPGPGLVQLRFEQQRAAGHGADFGHLARLILGGGHGIHEFGVLLVKLAFESVHLGEPDVLAHQLGPHDLEFGPRPLHIRCQRREGLIFFDGRARRMLQLRASGRQRAGERKGGAIPSTGQPLQFDAALLLGPERCLGLGRQRARVGQAGFELAEFLVAHPKCVDSVIALRQGKMLCDVFLILLEAELFGLGLGLFGPARGIQP